jgi:hypothetical protein
MVHWLQIGGIKSSMKNEDIQWANLKKYLEEYPESKAVVYIKETGDIFCKVVKLECSQNYNDLDLDCNSMFNGSIRHLNHKPNDIALCRLQLDYYFNRRREA